MRSAILRWPMASTIGAGATVGSYLIAMAMCVGFTITTSAFGTSFIIWRRAYERAMARRRCLIVRIAVVLLHLLLHFFLRHLERLLELPPLPDVVAGGEREVRAARRGEHAHRVLLDDEEEAELRRLRQRDRVGQRAP